MICLRPLPNRRDSYRWVPLHMDFAGEEVEGNYVPLHTYLLAQTGKPIIELAYLEELARDRVYEFAFIGGSLKLRGSDAAPLRPTALPLR